VRLEHDQEKHALGLRLGPLVQIGEKFVAPLADEIRTLSGAPRRRSLKPKPQSPAP
jgi:hypothetical protein